MSIETKFNVGDTAFTIDPQSLRVRKFIVKSITTYSSDKGTTINLYPEDGGYAEHYEEYKCFATRDDLMQHITSE